jgi:hypothetical protein
MTRTLKLLLYENISPEVTELLNSIFHPIRQIYQ